MATATSLLDQAFAPSTVKSSSAALSTYKAPSKTTTTTKTPIKSTTSTTNTTRTSAYPTSSPTPGPTPQMTSIEEPGFDAEEEARRYNAALEEAYAPAVENLRQVEQAYQGRQNEDISSVMTSFEQNLPILESEKKGDLETVARQEGEGKKRYKDNLTRVRELYNALRSGLLVRYGGSSSTGEATQELLSRDTQRDFNDLSYQYEGFLQEIDREELEVNKFYATKTNELIQKKEDALKEIRRTYQDALMDINKQRSALETEKSMRRLEALQTFSAQARQLKADYSRYQQSLNQWMQYKQEIIDTARQYNAKSINLPSYNPTTGAIGQAGWTSQAARASSPAPSEAERAAMNAAGYYYSESDGKYYRRYPDDGTGGGNTPINLGDPNALEALRNMPKS